MPLLSKDNFYQQYTFKVTAVCLLSSLRGITICNIT